MSAQRLTQRLAHNKPPGFVLGEAGGRWHRALKAAGRAVGLFHIPGLRHWRDASKVLLNQLYALTSPLAAVTVWFVGAGGETGTQERNGGEFRLNAQSQAHRPAGGEIRALSKRSFWGQRLGSR